MPNTDKSEKVPICIHERELSLRTELIDTLILDISALRTVRSKSPVSATHFQGHFVTAPEQPEALVCDSVPERKALPQVSFFFFWKLFFFLMDK